MFTATDVIEAPRDSKASLVRVIGVLNSAMSIHAWIKSHGLVCDLPMPAIWETEDHFKVFGYQIKVLETRDTVVRKLVIR